MPFGFQKTPLANDLPSALWYFSLSEALGLVSTKGALLSITVDSSFRMLLAASNSPMQETFNDNRSIISPGRESGDRALIRLNDSLAYCIFPSTHMEYVGRRPLHCFKLAAAAPRIVPSRQCHEAGGHLDRRYAILCFP